MAACKSDKEIKISTAARVYVDQVIVDEKFSAYPDSIPILRDKVLVKYKMSKEDYRKIYDVIAADSGKWNKFFKIASGYLDSLKKAGVLD